MKRELGDMIAREITFEQLVTVQEVDITPDLKHAHVYVSVLGGGEAGAKSALSKLHDRRKELQGMLAKRVILKFTPQLHFKLDVTVERGTRIIDILESLDLPPLDPNAPAGDQDDGTHRPE